MQTKNLEPVTWPRGIFCSTSEKNLHPNQNYIWTNIKCSSPMHSTNIHVSSCLKKNKRKKKKTIFLNHASPPPFTVGIYPTGPFEGYPQSVTQKPIPLRTWISKLTTKCPIEAMEAAVERSRAKNERDPVKSRSLNKVEGFGQWQLARCNSRKSHPKKGW